MRHGVMKRMYHGLDKRCVPALSLCSYFDTAVSRREDCALKLGETGMQSG